MLIDGDKFLESLHGYKNNLTELVNITELQHNRVRYQAAMSMVDQIIKSLPGFEIAEPATRGVRRNDNAAAKKASDTNLGDSEARTLCLHALNQLGEATTAEIAAKVRSYRPGVYRPNSVERRVTDLVQMGLFEKTGKRQANPSGRLADVLRLRPAS